MAVKIVMGVSCSGKTKFIKEHFPEWRHHSVGAIQRSIYQELKEQGKGPFVNDIQVILEANERIKNLVVEDLKAGHDVVMEHTLFKAKRRIGYVNEFRKVTDEPIDIYLLQPTDEELWRNVEESPISNKEYEYLKREIFQIEIPNIAEGYAHIYIVTEGVITEHIAELDESIIEQAKEELLLEEEKDKEAEVKRKEKEALLEKMEKDGFWHYCEVCGKKELLNSKQAFEKGWDYPGMHGLYKKYMPNYGFGTISPRTCGECGIMETTYMKLVKGEVTIDKLEGREKETIERILTEPNSLL